MKKLCLAAVLLLVAAGHAQNVTGTISAASSSCTATSCVNLPFPSIQNGTGAVAVVVSANAGGNTLQFEGTADGSTYAAVNAFPLNSTTAATSTTSTGTWQMNVAGLVGIRVRCSTLSSGTSTVTIQSSPASARNGGGGTSSGTGTTNTIAKFTSASGIGNSSCTDDGTANTRCPNGLNTATAGLSEEYVNAGTGGTAVNKVFVIDSSQHAITATVAQTTGIAGVAIAGAGTTGSVTGCITQCSVLYDNQTTIGHVAIVSTSVAGELHDTGAASQTAGVDNFLVDATNSGAGTVALTDILTPRNVGAAVTTLAGKPQIWAPTFCPILGSCSTVQIWATKAPTNATFPANFAGISVSCGAAPSGTVTWTLVDVTNSNTTLGSFGVTSGCAITAAATTGGLAQAITAKDFLTLTSGTDASGLNIAFWISATPSN